MILISVYCLHLLSLLHTLKRVLVLSATLRTRESTVGGDRVDKATMNDLNPPPPYSVEDPNRSNAALHALTSQHILASTSLISSNGHTSTGGRPPVATTSLELNSMASPGTHRFESGDNCDLEKAGFISAFPYFELRSHSNPRPANTLYHRAVIGPETRPADLPYPEPSGNWLQRSVDVLDWKTFLNHLFPEHSIENHASSSEKVLKSRVGLSFHGRNLESNSSRSQGVTPLLGTYSTGDQSKLMDPYGDNGETDRLRQLRLNAVAMEWNTGFFEPRGLKVVIDLNSSSFSTRSPNSPSSTGTRQRYTSDYPQRSPLPARPKDTLLHQAVAKGSKSKVKEALEKEPGDLETPNLKGETALYRAVVQGDKAIVRILLDKGANPAARPPQCSSPLYITVNRDRKSILEMLLARSTREEIEETTPTGETSLYLAVKKRHKSCVELLLVHGANPNSCPAGQESILNLAVLASQTSIVKLLLEHGANVEERNKDGDTPLCCSVKKGESRMVAALLKYGATVAAGNLKGEAPLSIAVSRGETSIVALLLARKEVDVEVENAKGETPLYTAVTRGEPSMAVLLLSKGASPTHSPPHAETMLNLAVSRGNPSLTRLLLNHIVDVDVPNKAGETPLFKAVSNGDTSTAALLVGKGASVNIMSPSGETALYKAIYRGDTSITSLLLCNGANPEIPSPSGETPLYRAVHKGDISMVSLLLCHGASPDTPAPSGETPLYRAVCRNESSIVLLLLAKGANPDTICGSAETALQYAARKGNKTMIQILSSHTRQKQS
jgi:ankyrin repeat protein